VARRPSKRPSPTTYGGKIKGSGRGKVQYERGTRGGEKKENCKSEQSDTVGWFLVCGLVRVCGEGFHFKKVVGEI